MSNDLFAIRLILRIGTPMAVALALMTLPLIVFLLYPTIGWFSIAVAFPLSAVVLILFKSYVEMMSIVFQMAH